MNIADLLPTALEELAQTVNSHTTLDTDTIYNIARDRFFEKMAAVLAGRQQRDSVSSAIAAKLLNLDPALGPHLLIHTFEASHTLSLKRDGKKLTIISNNFARDKHGVYFTPIRAVNHMVEACLNMATPGRSFSEIRSLRIIDPAMGGGIFLVEAFRQLTKLLQQAAMREGRRTTLASIAKHVLDHCIFGVDISAAAVRIARLALQIAGESLGVTAFGGQRLVVGDSLEPFLIERRKDGFSWHRTYKEVMTSGGFDIVVGNPPYDVLDRNSVAHARYRFESKRGKVNLATMFMHLVKDLIKPGGMFSFVVPRNILADRSLTSTRAMLFIEDFSVSRVEVFPKEPRRARLFEQASIPALILVARRQPAKHTSLDVIRYRSGENWEVEFCSVINSTTLHGIIERFDAIPVVSQDDLRLIEGTLAWTGNLGNLFGQLRQGEINVTTYREAIGTSKRGMPLVEGKNIKQQKVTPPTKRVLLAADDKKADLLPKLRVVMQGINGVDDRRRLIAAVTSNTLCAHSTNFMMFERLEDANLFCAILSSEYAERFFRFFSCNNNVNSYEIARIPFDEKVLRRLHKQKKPISGTDVDRALSISLDLVEEVA
jgi:hypothetical protein